MSENPKNKICPKCNLDLSIESFGFNKTTNQFRSACKRCVARRERELRADPVGGARRRLNYNRRRASNPEKFRKWNADWRRATPDISQREYARRNKQKSHARITLRNAVAAGHVVKPEICQGCGLAKPLHGHHEDYSAPLQVEWLCSTCHGLRHRKPIPLQLARELGLTKE